MNFFNTFMVALIKPKKYNTLLDAKKGFCLLYIIIFLAVSLSVYIVGFTSIYKNIGIYYREVVPDFSFENSTLTMSEPFRLELMGQIIYADTEKELTQKDFGDNVQGIMFDADSIIFRQMGQDSQIKYTNLTENEPITFSKNNLGIILPLLKTAYVAFSIFMLLTLVAGFFIRGLIIALLSKFPNATVGLSFGKLYKLSLFSQGLPILLSFIISFFISPMPFVISILISCIIMNIALGKMSKNKSN